MKERKRSKKKEDIYERKWFFLLKDEFLFERCHFKLLYMKEVGIQVYLYGKGGGGGGGVLVLTPPSFKTLVQNLTPKKKKITLSKMYLSFIFVFLDLVQNVVRISKSGLLVIQGPCYVTLKCA